MRPLADITRFFTALALVMSVAAGPALADEEAHTKTINVAPQSLSSALRDFSEQSGLQVAYVSTLAENVTSRGTQDATTPTDALTQILDDTGLEHQFVNEHTVAIGPATTAKDEAEDPGYSQIAPNPVTMVQNRATNNGTIKRMHGQGTVDHDSERRKPRTSIEEIVVTGSHIRGVDVVGAMSIAFTHEDMVRAGYSTVEEFLQSMPQNLDEITPDAIGAEGVSPVNSGNYVGASSVSLRGLAPVQRLYC